MFRVETGALDRGPVEVSGTVAVDDPLFDDLDCELGEPVQVSGLLSSASLGRFYWRGTLATVVNAACRRCLTPTQLEISTRVEVVFTEDQDSEDPSEYVVPEGTDVIDFGEAIREELILAADRYVLCREDCRGLCPSCGTDLNQQSCGCRPPPDPRWSALEAIRTKRGE